LLPGDFRWQAIMSDEVWTDGELACLRRLWAAGIPARMIAVRLQKKPDVVLGKAKLLNLPDRDEPPENCSGM
jgi:hypothetical protein